jgi:hypothetical protein
MPARGLHQLQQSAGYRHQRWVGGADPADYWPTAGWRTAAPNVEGMDPAVLDELDTKVPDRYPQVRSLLVVRHGYLVYERYWHGLDASDGHNSHSVTGGRPSAQRLDRAVGGIPGRWVAHHGEPGSAGSCQITGCPGMRLALRLLRHRLGGMVAVLGVACGVGGHWLGCAGPVACGGRQDRGGQ